MSFICTLSDAQLSNLYKDVYGHMKQSKGEFDALDYSRKLFQAIKQQSEDVDAGNNNAIKFVQVVPRMIANIAMNDPSIKIDLNSVRDLMVAFEKPATGFKEILDRVSETDEAQQKAIESLRALYQHNTYNVEKPVNNDNVDEKPKKPFTAFASTNQQLIPKQKELIVKPTKKGEASRKKIIEQRNDLKKKTYDIYSKIKESSDYNELGFYEAVYTDRKGKETKLFLKPILAEKLLEDHKKNKIILEDIIASDLNQSQIIKRTGKSTKDTNLIDRVVLVLADENENILSFDNEGFITEPGQYAHPVISYQRVVEQNEDGSYRVVNHEGEQAVQSPEELSKTYLHLTIDEIVEMQQEEFKQLHDIQTQTKKSGEGPLLRINGLSEGVVVDPAKRIVPFQQFLTLKNVKENPLKILNTIQYVEITGGNFISGQTTITVGKSKYLLKTPKVNEAVVNNLIEVLSDSKLTAEDKLNFHNQLFNNPSTTKLKNNKIQRHTAFVTKEEGIFKLIFLDSQDKQVTVELTKDNNTLTDADKEIIKNALLNTYGEGKPTTMHFMSEDITKNYSEYKDGRLKKVGTDSYLNFLLSLGLEVDTINGPVNSYLLFSEFTDLEKKKQEEEKQEPVKVPEPGQPEKVSDKEVINYKEIRDDIIKALRSSSEFANPISISKPFGSISRFNIAVNLNGETVSTEFYNHKSHSPVDLNKQATLEEIQVEGHTDVVGVFQEGKLVGVIRISSDQEFKQAEKAKKGDLPKSNPATDVNTSKGSDAQVIKGRKFDLSRNKELTSRVSKKQVEAAKDWWQNSPLSKFIQLDVLMDVVNSDAFAKFLIDGSTLVSPEMLAKIELYKDGNMVDIYHEAWHGFSQLFLTKNQKTELYNEVRDSNSKYKDLNDGQIEELLAEDFRTYAKNQKSKKGSPKRNNIFKRIWNFLTSLFGKVRNFNPNKIAGIPAVKEMYDKLYFASENPSLLAEYKPSLENVMFSEMNRAKAINSVTAGKEYSPVLSVSDSTLLSDTMDSMISDIIDANIKDDSKAIVLGALRYKNKEALYGLLKDELAEKLKNFKEKLQDSKKKVGNENVIKFNDLTTEQNINAIAPVVITRKDGFKVYGLLSSQVENMENLVPDFKKGEKVKGQVYHNINIVTDFYKHKTVKSKLETGKEEPTRIIIGDSVQELVDQYLNFKEDGQAKTWVDIEQKDIAIPELTAEQTVLQNNIRILETALANWGDQKKGVRAYHQKNSRYEYLNAERLRADEVDEDGMERDFTQQEDKDPEDVFDRKQGKQSVEDTAHPEIKYLIKSLHKLDPVTEKPILNKLGAKELANSGFIWAHLVKHLTGLKSPQEMYNKLKEMVSKPSDSDTKFIIPELKQLIKKLPDPNKAITNSNSFDLVSGLFHSFNKPEASYLQTTFIQQADGTFETHVLQSSMKESTVLAQWANKFKYGQVDNDYVGEVNGVRTLILDNILKKSFNKEDSFYFLQSVGIKLDHLVSIVDEVENNHRRYGILHIYDAFKYALELERKQQRGEITLSDQDKKIINNLRQDPIKTLSNEYTLYGKTFSNRTNMQRLAKLQVERGIEAYSQGVPNAAGDNVFPHIDNNAITRVVNALNDGETLADVFSNNPHISFLNPLNNPYTERLQIINKLFDLGTQNRRLGTSLSVFANSGTHIVYNKDTNEGVNTTDLDSKSYLLQNIHSLLLAGVQEMPRHASKKTSMGMRVEGQDPLYISVKDLAQREASETDLIKEVIIPHIAAEFDRIRMFKANRSKYEKYTGYNNEITYADGTSVLAGEIFTAFDNVLTKNTKEKLYYLITDDLSKFSLEQILESSEYNGLQKQIISDVKNYFKEMTEDTSEFLGSQAFIAKNLLEETGLENAEDAKNVVLKAFSYNSFIHNFETAILIYGDMAQYNHIKEELHKRNTGSTSGGPAFRTDSAAKEFINGAWLQEQSYAASENISPKQYTGILNTAVIRDNEIKGSVYSDDIKKGLTEYYSNLVLPNGKKLTKAQIEEAVNEDMSPYSGMDEGDGAGYINIDAYRNLKKLENDWSEAQEELFQKMIKNEELNPFEVVEMFPPYKLQNFGHMAVEGLPALSMHKFALFPLIPNMIKNSDLESLHRQMLEKGVDYVTFKTGSKGVTITSDGQADAIYDEAGNFMSDIQFTSNPVYVEYLKKSSSTNHYFKKHITYPTQKRGLLLNHLYNQGIPKSEALEILGKRYQDVVKQYSEVVKLELLNEIGYKYNPEDNTYSGNHAAFLRLVNDELEARDVPKHLLDSITTDLNGYVSHDLSYHIKADKIEQVLVSLIEKRLTKQEVTGEPLVQMPATMFNGIWDQTPEVLGDKDPRIKTLLGTNNLPFYNRGEYNSKTKTYGSTGKLHIAIALQGPFLNLLRAEYNGEVIETIDRLNEAIKDPEWLKDNEELVTLVGDRIPIQDHGSLEVAKVHHFLPANMSNIVVVPTEMVAKAGSDFDVDKIFWQFPEIGKNGKLVTSEASLEELQSMLADPKKATQARKEIAKKKKALNNELIKANSDILTSPEVYPYLIKPNNTYLWTDLAKSMEKYYDNEYNRYKTYHNEGDREILDKKGRKGRMISPSTTLTPLYQVHKLDVNMVGKDGLGVVALENKIHPILKSIGYKMPKTINIYNTPISLPFSLMFEHNKTPEGNISLSNDYNVDGEKIADLNSHLMNGLVDVEKDAWVFYVRANMEQLPIMNFMIQSGVNREQIVYFLSQPLIREYVDQSLNLKSLYYKIANPDEESRMKRSDITDRLLANVLGSKKLATLNHQANIRKQIKILESLPKNSDIKLYGKKETAANVIKKIKFQNKPLFFNANGIDYKRKMNTGNYQLIPFVEEILKEETGIQMFNADILKDGLDGNLAPEAQALALVQYLHLINQTRDHNEAKKLFNPDTKVSKSSVMSFSRSEALKNAKLSPNVDKESLEKLEKESILSSFFANDISNQLLKPLFELRLEPKIMGYAFNSLTRDGVANKVRRMFGRGDEGRSKYFASFGNAVINTIFQNNMSYNIDNQGNIITIPTEYKGTEIVKDPKSNKGAKVEGSKIIVNEALLNKFYNENVENEDFVEKFPNLQLYVKHILEASVQKIMYPEKTTAELEKRAAIFAFNPTAMFKGNDGYTMTLLDLVNKYDLRNKFDVLASLQVAQAPSRKDHYLLTVANHRDISPEVATEYANQLLQLADPTVAKVKDKALNYEISEFFSVFPEVLLYQHGFGYSKDGINNMLPQKDLIQYLDGIGSKFINNQLSGENPVILDYINKTLLEYTPVKDYSVKNISDFNDPSMISEMNETFEDDESGIDEEGKVRYVADGIDIIQSAITREEELELFEYLKPYLETQASQTNKGTQAPLMIGLGLRWDYTSNNPDKKPLNVGEIINNTPYQKNKYGYYDTSIDGKPLGQISNRLKQLMTKATGIDATHYDGAIINIYQKNSFISAHNDVDESATAINYPVLVLNLGGPGSLSVEGAESQKAKKPYTQKEYLNEPLDSRDAYVFGRDGQNRDVYHRTLPAPVEGTLPELNVRGKIIPANSYRITITLRRVMPLTGNMPLKPSSILPTQAPVSADKFAKKNLFTVTPIQAADKKAITKASIATQFIGFAEGIPGSSTELYRQQAGAFANTGNYSANDVIFVSIGGKRPANNLQLRKSQQDKTIKEAIKAVEAGATILTDNKSYINSSSYNEGEKRLYANMEAKGYNYSEITIDGQVIGTWSKTITQPTTSTQTELTPQEQKMLEDIKGLKVAQIKTLQGKSVLSFGIMQPEWESLSDREKIKFLNCN